MKRSKRYIENDKLLEKGGQYPFDEAIELLKKARKVKFDETIEAHFKLNINPEKTEQQVRGNAELPHGTGKILKIAVFSEDEKVIKEAKNAGAQITGGEELVGEIQTKGSVDFNVAVATPDMMPKLAKIAKVLGPKGLMPNPKNDTVTQNVEKTVNELLKGKVSFKSDKLGIVHISLGKISFDSAALKENYESLKKSLEKTKPSGVKSKFIRSISLTSTMGPGIRIG